MLWHWRSLERLCIDHIEARAEEDQNTVVTDLETGFATGHLHHSGAPW